MKHGYIFNYKANRIKNKGKSHLFFKVLAITFSILIAVMFIGAMTGGFFGLGTGGGALSFVQRDFYAVNSGSYDSYSAAEAAAHSLKVRGGAGYIHRDKAYMALAAMYPDKDSATKVAQRMGGGFSVYKITLPAFRLKVQEQSASAKLKNAVTVFYSAADLLYDAAVKLDGSKISETDALGIVARVANSAALAKSALDDAPDTSHAVILLRAELLSLSINLGMLSDNGMPGYTLNVKLKYYLIKTVLGFKNYIHEVR